MVDDIETTPEVYAQQVMGEREELRRKGYSTRPCPHCGQQRLARRHLRLYLRPLRRLGIDYGEYLCRSCEKRVLIRKHY